MRFSLASPSRREERSQIQNRAKIPLRLHSFCPQCPWCTEIDVASVIDSSIAAASEGSPCQQRSAANGGRAICDGEARPTEAERVAPKLVTRRDLWSASSANRGDPPVVPLDPKFRISLEKHHQFLP